MKKLLGAVLVCLFCLSLCACGEEKETVDYTAEILGVWYAVEYETEYVEFREDGTVADTFGSDTTYGDYLIDNENALIWVNFGDDVFALRITEEDGRLILLDNNGTLVREEDCVKYRTEYQQSKQK